MSRGIDESTVLSRQDITDLCEPIFQKFKVRFCYLFGDYARGTAYCMSEVKLMVDCQATEQAFRRMENQIKSVLRKQIVLLSQRDMSEHRELMSAVNECCVKIYG